MKKFFFAVFIIFISGFAVSAQERPSSLLEKRVSFSLPATWEIQKLEDLSELGRIQLIIPYPETDDTPHSANAAIIANPVPRGTTIKKVGDRVLEYPFPGMAVVNDIPDGKEWRIIVWTARNQGVPYLSLNRFGCSNGVAVEVLVAFPLLEKGNPQWVEKTIAEFNALCETLKIDGKNTTNAKVLTAKLPDNPKPEVPARGKPKKRS